MSALSPPMDVENATEKSNCPTVQQEKKLDLVMITAGFFMGSALELSFNSPSSIQPPISSATLYCLALLLLIGFSCIISGSVVGSKYPSFAKSLNHAGVFIGVTAFVFAIAMPFPTVLKCGIWAVYTCSLLFLLICNFCCN